MRKIFVLDDNEEILDLTKAILDPGYKVECFITAKELLERLSVEKPDLFIMDLMLPDVDGRSLQLFLSQNESFRHIPVVISSAHARAKILFAGQKQVIAFIEKPFKMQDLLSVVDRVLGPP